MYCIFNFLFHYLVFFIFVFFFFFFFSSRRRHTRYIGDWSSDVCSSDLLGLAKSATPPGGLSIASPSVHRQVPHFGCTAWFRCVRSSKIAQDSPDARSEERRVGKECRIRRRENE